VVNFWCVPSVYSFGADLQFLDGSRVSYGGDTSMHLCVFLLKL
jgi:hypothetical protein